MPDSRVTRAEIDDKNIVLTVSVDAFAPGEYVEVSGCATQAYETQGDGGFATFSEIQEIKKPKTGNTPELEVRAKLTKDFKDGPDITVVVRVAKVWITVLSQGASSESSSSSTGSGRMPWASVEGVGGPDEYPPAAGSTDQTAAGVPSAPPA